MVKGDARRRGIVGPVHRRGIEKRHVATFHSISMVLFVTDKLESTFEGQPKKDNYE